MKANETKLSKIIEGTNQYLVPHFQRPYTWDKRDWEALWGDVCDLLPADDLHPHAAEHFIGSIVTAPAHSVPEGVTKYLLIDGQQRLTTLLLLLTAIRDRATALGDQRLAPLIQDTYLTNRFHPGQDHLKLLPTQGDAPNNNDRAAFHAFVLGSEAPATVGLIGGAVKFFHSKLQSFEIDELNALHLALVNRVLLVSIVLEHGDNPYAIFESLNAKGQPLSQADLLRNLFFMSIDASQHDRVYREKWLPMERFVGRPAMEEFIRHYLIAEGVAARQSEVYVAMKARLERRGKGKAETVLDELVAASKRYGRLLDPAREASAAVRLRLERLNRLRATVCYPFLLKLEEERELGRLPERDLVEILDIIENFVLRRYVAGVIRAELNNVFAGLYNAVHAYTSRREGTKEILGSRNYPGDGPFTQALEVRELYGQGGEIRDRASYILERLEAFEAGKETVNAAKLTIEHVMPQTLSELWRVDLGPDAEEVHTQFLHSLGNLTLTGYNSELSNLPFEQKRLRLAESNLTLNRDIARCDVWDGKAIVERGRRLSELALKVWPNFAPHAGARRIEVRGTTPVAVNVYGNSYPVTSWQDVLRTTVSTLAQMGDDVLPMLADAFPRYFSRDGSVMRHPKQIVGDYVYESHLNAEQVYRVCNLVVQRMGLTSSQWEVTTRAVTQPGASEPTQTTFLFADD